MQLTLHADYSLRILLYLAEHRDRRVSTREISEAYGISRNHLVRVVATLSSSGFVALTEGRGGGAALARDPALIGVGEVVRKAEPNFRIVECFDAASNTCRILPVCGLRGVLAEALNGFFAVLDRYTLADLVPKPGEERLSQYLQITSPG